MKEEEASKAEQLHKLNEEGETSVLHSVNAKHDHNTSMSM